MAEEGKKHWQADDSITASVSLGTNRILDEGC